MKKIRILIIIIITFSVNSLFSQYDLYYNDGLPKQYGQPVETINNTYNVLNARYNQNVTTYNDFIKYINESFDSDKNSLIYRSQLYAYNKFVESMSYYRKTSNWHLATESLNNAMADYYVNLRKYPEIEKESLKEKNDKCKLLAVEGYNLIEEKKVNLAIEKFSQSLAEEPSYGYALYGRASAYLSINLFANALKDMNLFVELFPEEILGYVLRSKINQRIGNLQSAKQDCLKGLSIQENSKLYETKGWINYQLKDYKSALDDFNKQVLLDVNNPKAYYNRGSAKSELKDYNGAISDYKEAIRLYPNYSMAYNNIGWAKFELKKFNEALVDLNMAIKLDSKNSVAYDSRAEVKFNLMDFKGSIEDCNIAISLNPKLSNSFFIRGRCKFKLNDKTSACIDWKKALELGKYEANNFISKYCN